MVRAAFATGTSQRGCLRNPRAAAENRITCATAQRNALCAAARRALVARPLLLGQAIAFLESLNVIHAKDIEPFGERRHPG